MSVSDDGWLTSVRQCLTPHQDARPLNMPIDAIVIHGISVPEGDFSTTQPIDDLFLGRLDPSAHPEFAKIAHLKVSAHVLIDRQGVVTQYASFLNRAWHAGVSELAGRPRCNDFSIGIELQGVDDQPYTDAQYSTLIKIIAILKKRFPEITNQRIVGHADIAPGRKTDPGESFEWARVWAIYPRVEKGERV